MKKVYFLSVILMAAITAWTQKTWEGPVEGGSWTDPTNWSGDVVPAPTDIVQFDVGSTLTISEVPALSLAGLIVTNGTNITLSKPAAGGANTLTITNGTGANDFVINTGSLLTLGNEVNITLSAGAAGSIAGQINVNTGNTYESNGISTVTGTGVIQNVGIVTSAAAANLIFQNGGTYIHARNGGAIPTATWDEDANADIIGIINAAPAGLSQSFGNFEWDNSQAANIILNGSLQDVKGDLTIVKTSENSIPQLLSFTRNDNYTLNIGGDLNIQQTPAAATTNVVFLNAGSGIAIINVAGDYNHSSGTLAFTRVLVNGNPGTATLNLAGNLLQTGGDIDFTIGDEGPAGQKGSMTIKGNFSQTGGTVRTTTGDPEIVNGLITFNKAGIQTFNATTPANVSYVNFIIADGSTLQLNSDLRISRDFEPNWIGKLTVNSGGTIDASTFVIASQIEPDVDPPATAFAQFNLLANGKLITANTNGVEGSVNTADNLTVSLSSDADYEFQGASTGVFVTTTPNTIRDLIVNNTSGNVLLDMPITVTGTLALTDGLLSTTQTNLPTIAAAGTTTPAITSSFVNGPLAKEGTVAFTFPVGKSGAGFRNIGITTPSGSATFRAEFFRATPPAGTLEPTLTRISSCEYWDLSKTAGAAGVSANVVLSWETNSSCGGAYVTDPTTLRVAHFLDDTWIDEGRSASTGNNAAGTVTSSDAPTTFSPFALAGSSAANPLPVLFADVKAYKKNNGVQIEWSNLTEKDVAEYTIERSANGTDFTAIGQQLPMSNQNDRADYIAFDVNPGTGINFYRVKAQETTGKIVYSIVLNVNLDNADRGLRLYPNPVRGNQVTISLSNMKRGQYSLRIVNTAGQDILKQNINNQSSNLTQTVDLPSSAKPGVYNMVLTGDDYRETKTFIVQ